MNQKRSLSVGGAIALSMGVLTLLVAVIVIVGGLLGYRPPATPFTVDHVPEDIPPAIAPEIPESSYVEASKIMGVPHVALHAYVRAADTLQAERPQCGLGWNTLAGVGKVETAHGSYNGKKYNGAELDAKGTAQPSIFGPALDGSGGFADLADTDQGLWDGDSEHDRAMGPMQFIPDAWRDYGQDADGDGEKNPQNIYDASLAAAYLLCSNNRDMRTTGGWSSAVMTYNNSYEYVLKVRNAAAEYAILGQKLLDNSEN